MLITDTCHGLEPITVILDFWKYSLLEKQLPISELEFFLKDQGSNFQVQYWMGCVFLLMSITSSCENSLSCLTESTRETSIGSGSILVIQLSRFSTSFSGLMKDQQVFNCSSELDLDCGRWSIFLHQIFSYGINQPFRYTGPGALLGYSKRFKFRRLAVL